MAIRTAAAAALDADIAQLVADLKTYLGLLQTNSPGDSPAILFWNALLSALRNADPQMAMVIDSAGKFDSPSFGKTLSQIDGFA
jgi:hypothetical protein